MLNLAVLALFLCILPGGYAGPACTKKYYQTTQCVQKCQARWGYPGTMMGTNRWGSVMQHVDDPSNDGWKAVIADACGMPSSSAKKVSTGGDSSDVSGAVGSKPDFNPDDSTETMTVFATTSSTATSSKPTESSSSTHPIPSIKKSQPPPAAFQAPPPTSKKPDPTTIKQKQAPAPEPTPPSDNGDDSSDQGGGSSDQGGDIGQYLKGHNDFRKLHGASPLTWSDNLASKAQQWANRCQFKHSGGSLGPFGENLAAGTGSSYGIASGIKSWTDESKDYDPHNPQASHFTQVVWKNTKQVGCALQECDGIFDPKFGKAKFIVCEYDPPGNFNNDFAANVQV